MTKYSFTMPSGSVFDVYAWEFSSCDHDRSLWKDGGRVYRSKLITLSDVNDLDSYFKFLNKEKPWNYKYIFVIQVMEKFLDWTGSGMGERITEMYGRSWLFDPYGRLLSRTPGIQELWDIGTLDCPPVFEVGDEAAIVVDDRLRTALIQGTPTHSDPECLRKCHQAKFKNSGCDVLDNYLWYCVQVNFKSPYDDEQLTHTDIFPFKLNISRKKKRKIALFRRNFLDSPDQY